MPLKAPPPPPPVWSWTGMYFGLHVGGGWGAKDWDLTQFDGEFLGNLHNSFPVNGFLGGAQLGYRWQSGMWVWGIEGSISGAGITGQSACVELDFNCKSNVDWLATATAQVGWAVDHALLYVKGGAALAGDHHSIAFIDGDPCVIIPGDSCSRNETRLGALFGAGITYAFDPHWSAFIEYNYMDFGTKTNDFFTDGDLVRFDISQQIHVIKAGVNWKCDWWAGGY
jgi:outer membrane immunogenic protein